MGDDSAQGAISIPLVEHWDATMSYDILEPSGDERNVPFVGRENLKGGLVTMIADPDARGSVLVSGYRGAGKTTLVIESAREAKQRLLDEGEGWELLPVAVNVSEVSASMTAAGAEADDEDAVRLRVHPNLLLTALIREFSHRAERVRKRTTSRNGMTGDGVATLITETFEKAIATTWTKEDQHAESEESEKVSERVANATSSDLPKALGTLAVSALAAWGVGAAGRGVAEMVASAAAALLVVSFAWSVTSRRAASRRRSMSVSARFDKSVHQLETDLKDILAGLHELRFRTVVILEELDKMDSDGDDLEAVIRYFKNLFTQSPALFFFITDKEYFDTISAKIKRARRRRSYAIEHTFFTQRVYVGRPSSDDCLDYLESILADDTDIEHIRSIRQADEARSRSLESMDRREQFVRYLLYQSDNHLFDLKNEMRRFVRARSTGPVLEFDNVSFPQEEAAVAALQFLAQRKVRSFWFGPSSSYASELLHDSLFSTFLDVDSDWPQSKLDLYPSSAVIETGPPPPTTTDPAPTPDGSTDNARAYAIAEQLTIGQARRIRDAVDSLLSDLERGGAIVVGVDDFNWESPAATNFRPAPELEEHERILLARLTELAQALGPLAIDPHVTSAHPSLAANAGEQREQLLKRAEEVRAGERVITANESEQQYVNEERLAESTLGPIYEDHATSLSSAFQIDALSRTTHLVPRLLSSKDSRSTAPVFLAYGRPAQAEATARRIWSEIESRELKQVGVLWVDPHASTVERIDNGETASRLLAVAPERPPGARPLQLDGAWEVVMPLLPETEAGAKWTRPALLELLLLYHRVLGALDRRSIDPAARYVLAPRGPQADEKQPEPVSLVDAMREWWKRPEQRVFCGAKVPDDQLRGAASLANIAPLVPNATELLARQDEVGDAARDLFGRPSLTAVVHPADTEMLPQLARAIVRGAAPDTGDLELRAV